MSIDNDLSSELAINNPSKYYNRIREAEPVHWNNRWGGWMVTRYDDCKKLLRDNKHLSVELDDSNYHNDAIPETSKFFSQWIMFRDPPEHTRLRTLMAGAINSRSIRDYRADMETVTESLVQDIAENTSNEIDFINDFAFQLPVHVICKILGVPAKDRSKFKNWSANITPTLQHFYGEEDRHEKTEESIVAFFQYLQDLVEERKEDPGDDLISELIKAEEEGQMLDDDEVVANAMFLLIAGHETTTKLLTNCILELDRHPGQKRMLLDDLDLASNTIEEVLRYRSPVKAVTRFVKNDFEYEDNQFEEGQRILLGLTAANRDPEKFDDPDEFDITREPNDHIAFGEGVHACIGAPLARLEAEVALPTFLEAFPEAEVVTEGLQWRGSAFGRALEELRLKI